MPDEELRAIREASKKNMEDIDRRQKANDPLEVRKIPDTDITLRVWGFIDRRPVIAAEDWAAFDAHMDAQYKCHWCLDAKRVYLHGEQHEPDVRRRGPGSACPGCCPVLTAADYWNECSRFPTVTDGGVDVQSLMRGAVNAYLNWVIAPHVTKAQYARLLMPIGSLVSLNGRALTVTFRPYTDPADADGGRLVLVDDLDDQGDDYLKNKSNKRPGDKD